MRQTSSGGGGNFADSYGPIDAAMIPELGANRFMFGHGKGVTVEYSNDSGVTWKDYGATESQRQCLLGVDGAYCGINYYLGKDKSRVTDVLRVTIDTSSETGINCYSKLNKFVIRIGEGGSTGCWCTIQKALQSSPTSFTDVVTKVPISGWTGYNVINVTPFTTYGNAPSWQYGRIRFIFGCTGMGENYASKYNGFYLLNIKAFGGNGWETPSTMAKNGHLYDIDNGKNASFPSTVTATQFNGPLNGKATSAGTADNASKVNNHTVNADVPSNAKFTDTTYDAISSSELETLFQTNL